MYSEEYNCTDNSDRLNWYNVVKESRVTCFISKREASIVNSFEDDFTSRSKWESKDIFFCENSNCLQLNSL